MIPTLSRTLQFHYRPHSRSHLIPSLPVQTAMTEFPYQSHPTARCNHRPSTAQPLSHSLSHSVHWLHHWLKVSILPSPRMLRQNHARDSSHKTSPLTMSSIHCSLASPGQELSLQFPNSTQVSMIPTLSHTLTVLVLHWDSVSHEHNRHQHCRCAYPSK